MRIHIHRTGDAPDIKALYAELVDRMLRAAHDMRQAQTKDTGRLISITVNGKALDAWEESKHPRAPDGRFGNKSGEHLAKGKNEAVEGGKVKTELYRLLSSGKPFTKDELAKLLDVPPGRITQYVAMLRNPKYSPKAGALDIKRNADGSYQVVTAEGKPAPKVEPPKAEPPAVDAKEAKRQQIRAYVETQQSGLRELSERWLALDKEGRASVKPTMAKASDLLHEASELSRTLPADASDRLSKIQTDYANTLYELRRELDFHKGRMQKAEQAQRLAKETSGKNWTAHATSEAVAHNIVKAGLADHADMTDIHVDHANAIASSLADHLAEFPALRKRQNYVGSTQGYYKALRERDEKQLRKLWEPLHGKEGTQALIEKTVATRPYAKEVPANVWAYSHSDWQGDLDSAVSMNAQQSKTEHGRKQFHDNLVRCAQTGFHPPGCDTVKSVFDHEYGHQLDKLLGLEKNSEMNDLFINAGGRARRALMTQKVSEYAAHNIKEFIAEAWAESKNAKQPRETAVKVAAIIRSEYARKYPQGK